MNSAVSWDVVAALDAFFASNSSLFANSKILDGTFTHAGIACTCHHLSTVICGFMFTTCMHGRTISDKAP